MEVPTEARSLRIAIVTGSYELTNVGVGNPIWFLLEEQYLLLTTELALQLIFR